MMGTIDIPIQQFKVLGKAGSSTAESIRRRSSGGRSPGRSPDRGSPRPPSAGGASSVQAPSTSTLPTDQSSIAPTVQSQESDEAPRDPMRDSASLLSPTSTGASQPLTATDTASTADSASTRPSEASPDRPPDSPSRKPSAGAGAGASGGKAKMAEDIATAMGVGRGFGRVVEAGFKSPMDFTLSLAQGFHNAPRLYGDTTVRPQERVTGFHSGAKAAAKVRDCLVRSVRDGVR